MRRLMITALAKAAREYGSTVVAVNRPLCPFSTFIKKPQRIKEILGKPRLEKLSENLYIISPRYFIHDFVANRLELLESMNLRALRKSYYYLQKKLGIEENNPIVWYYYPQQGYVSKLFKDNLCIYEIYDNLVSIWGSELPSANRLQKKHRDSVDLLLTASEKQQNKYAPLYKKSKLIGNGLGRDTFEKLTEDNQTTLPEITGIKSPRIGFVGMISDRLDWKLVTDLAALRPKWNYIFIGRVTNKAIKHDLNKFANIHFLGEYEPSQIPSVLKSFDIGYMPYLDNNFFRYSNPLKFYEYAAAGLASVSSNMEELNKFPLELVKIVPNNQPDKWVETIEEYLKADRGKTSRIGREVASHYIWEDMSAGLLGFIKAEFFE
jgi:hypothetical protein